MELPDGLFLQENVITVDKEQEIINWLDTRIWSSEISRRTQHYGYHYNYKSSNLLPEQPLSGPILEIANMLEQANLIKAEQCIVNEYFRNQGIAEHVDNLIFGSTIVSLSLGADCIMSFRKDEQIFICFIPRRSVMMMTGSARYEWKHSISKCSTYEHPITKQKIIKETNYRRISLTYRSLA